MCLCLANFQRVHNNRLCVLYGLAVLQHLKQLGVKSSFDRTKADFSRLSPEPLFISDVLQSVSSRAQLTSHMELTALHPPAESARCTQTVCDDVTTV